MKERNNDSIAVILANCKRVKRLNEKILSPVTLHTIAKALIFISLKLDCNNCMSCAFVTNNDGVINLDFHYAYHS